MTDKDKTDFIETDNDALTIISLQMVPVKTADDAFLMINAFADLRNYNLFSVDNDKNKKDYSQKIHKTDDTLIVSAVLQVNLAFYKMMRYTFKIVNSEYISLLSTKVIDAHPGGR